MAFEILGETVTNGFGVQTIAWEGFTIECVKSPRAPVDADFLPAKVVKDGSKLWSYERDHQGFKGLGQLVEVGDEELVIVLTTKRELHVVLPVRDLPHVKRVGGEFVGGRKLQELIALKELIANELFLEPVWSEREFGMKQAVRKAEQARENAERNKRLAEERAAREAADKKRADERARREAERREILARKRQHVFTATGERRNGVPVVGDEWMKLAADTFCVSVTTFDPETGAVGEPQESFVVEKKNGKPARDAVVAVTRENPLEKRKQLVVSFNPVFHTVPVKGILEEVIEVPDMDVVRALSSRGLNSGTLVMVPKTGDPGRYAIFRLTDGKIEPVTEVRKA